jgi:hypothetical protein
MEPIGSRENAFAVSGARFLATDPVDAAETVLEESRKRLAGRADASESRPRNSRREERYRFKGDNGSSGKLQEQLFMVLEHSRLRMVQMVYAMDGTATRRRQAINCAPR